MLKIWLLRRGHGWIINALGTSCPHEQFAVWFRLRNGRVEKVRDRSRNPYEWRWSLNEGSSLHRSRWGSQTCWRHHEHHRWLKQLLREIGDVRRVSRIWRSHINLEFKILKENHFQYTDSSWSCQWVLPSVVLRRKIDRRRLPFKKFTIQECSPSNGSDSVLLHINWNVSDLSITSPRVTRHWTDWASRGRSWETARVSLRCIGDRWSDRSLVHNVRDDGSGREEIWESSVRLLRSVHDRWIGESSTRRRDCATLEGTSTVVWKGEFFLW